MDDFEQYTLISKEKGKSGFRHSNGIKGDFETLSDRFRVATVVPLSACLRKRYQDHKLTVANTDQRDLRGFARVGNAAFDPDSKVGLTTRDYIPPITKMDRDEGTLGANVLFARVTHYWQKHESIVYLTECNKDDTYYLHHYTFILRNSRDTNGVEGFAIADKLILEASKWSLALHDELWLFDQLWWQKSSELWRSAQELSWDDVILDEDMKTDVREDIEGSSNDRE